MASPVSGQGGSHNHDDHSGHNHSHSAQGGHADGHDDHSAGGHDDHGSHFDPAKTAFHHISDQNVYNIGPFQFPLPCILYAPGKGWSVFSSSKFGIGAHGMGQNIVDGYVLHEGMVRRLEDNGRTITDAHLSGAHPFNVKEAMIDGKKREQVYALHQGKEYKTLAKSTLDGGFLGGGITNFYDFSITKNVMSMLLMALLAGWIFLSIAKAYGNRKGEAPRGLQSFMEPIFVFIQDEVCKPFLGHKWEKFQPFIMTLFFFILFLNLFGQIPFLGGSNVTGNLSFTLVLAVIAFFVVNLNGNKHYWKHILWMPGVPAPIKLILTPVEVIGLFVKPTTLMLRLAANITAGHVILVIFVGLIFIFKQQIGGVAGTGVGFAMSIPLTMFMMAIELLVAFIQAFVFAILTASYIGAATEEAHH